MVLHSGMQRERERGRERSFLSFFVYVSRSEQHPLYWQWEKNYGADEKNLAGIKERNKILGFTKLKKTVMAATL